ncbi:MAG: universal stress protein [Pseudomonadota bacterium]
MTTQTRSLARVLAVVDPGSPTPLLSAADLATRHGAELVVFSCIEDLPDQTALARAARLTPEEMLERLLQERYRQLEETLKLALPGRPARIEVTHGKAFIETIRFVIANEVDFVIKAAEPLTGVERFLFASTDQHLVRKCPCPVWLQVPGARRPPLRIIAAVDVDAWDADEPETLSDLNRRVIGTALHLATGAGAEVHVLHAWEAVGEGMIRTFSSGSDARLDARRYVNEVADARSRALDGLLRPFQEAPERDCGPALAPVLARGAVASVIAEHARDWRADVIVMGTVARTGLSGVIIGNTAENILNSVECSVVAVKPGTFVSPLDA